MRVVASHQLIPSLVRFCSCTLGILACVEQWFDVTEGNLCPECRQSAGEGRRISRTVDDVEVGGAGGDEEEGEGEGEQGVERGEERGRRRYERVENDSRDVEVDDESNEGTIADTPEGEDNV